MTRANFEPICSEKRWGLLADIVHMFRLERLNETHREHQTSNQQCHAGEVGRLAIRSAGPTPK